MEHATECLINRVRASRGLRALHHNRALQRVARPTCIVFSSSNRQMAPHQRRPAKYQILRLPPELADPELPEHLHEVVNREGARLSV